MELNAMQLFFALMESPYTHPVFVSDHTPVTNPNHLKWFIKDLHNHEGPKQVYDFDEVQTNINMGYGQGDVMAMMVEGLTDKHFRDGNH